MKKNPGFNKKIIATAIGSYALAGISGMAAAQDNSPMIEEIIVTGIFGSLQRSMDIKRDAQGIVDAISAEDIGKFPDTNLAESLQRVTGVSIDRANGEGSRVTVRGFGPDFNLVTLNGRQMPTSAIEDTSASATRSFDFANLASEGVSGVQVYKTGRASIPTGGIGATINILTNRPLDNPGLRASFSTKGVFDDSTDKGKTVTPEISGIYSQTFADDTFGVSISGSLQERESGSNVANTGAGWRTFTGETDQDWGAGTADWGGIPDTGHTNRPGPGDIYSVPQQLAYSFNEIQRTRTNGQLTLQYRPVDRFTGTVDYTYSELEVAQQYSDLSAWFNFGPSTGEWTDGPISSPLIYAEQTPGGSDLAMGGGNFARVNENESFGVNFEWQVNDYLVLEFDGHSSTAESRPDSVYGSHNAVGTAVFVRAESIADFSQDLPVMSIVYPDGVNAIAPQDIRVTGSSFRNSLMESEIDQFQFKGTVEFDGGQSINFGVTSTDVKNRSAFANVQRDDWGGVGAAGDFDNSFFNLETVADKFDIPGNNNPNLQNERYTFNFEDLVARAAQLYAAPGAGDCGTNFCPSTDYASQTDRRTQEKSLSVYAQLNVETFLADMPVQVAAGLRYEKTDVTSSAAVPGYSGVAWVSANEFSLLTTGTQDFTRLTGKYDKLLPSFDFAIDVMEDVVLRASASQTITRPGYGAIQGGTTVSQLARINGGDGARGNPNLLPFDATNVDLSAEWYYADASYVSAGWFWKDVKNFIGNSVVQEELFNLPHPADGPRYREAQAAVGNDANAIRDYIIANYPDTVEGNSIFGVPGEDSPLSFNVVIPINEKDAMLHGWELTAQHAFGDTGFGVIANLTLVDGDVEFDDSSLGEQFALFGLSDSANLVGFYEKGAIQARIAYNWRDKFLVSNFHGTGVANPIYTEAYGQWDANASYAVNEKLAVFVEGINLTDEYVRQHSRAEQQVLGVVDLGPRYNIGVRYSF